MSVLLVLGTVSCVGFVVFWILQERRDSLVYKRLSEKLDRLEESLRGLRTEGR